MMNNRVSELHRHLLVATVFVSGMTTLAVELAASRLLGAVFGVSNVVWASIIGLVLTYLAAGYFIGGRLADRYPNPILFYRVVTWGAFTSGLVPLIARAILPTTSTARLPFGIALLGALFILFTIPVTLLGCVTPYSIRLSLTDVTAAGQIAGKLYAFSTLGSVIGSLGPVLYTLPALGTTTTFLLFADILLVLALVALSTYSRHYALVHGWMLVVHLVIWVIR